MSIELSGGMRQRVSLARALAIDPEIVFLDEFFSQLDHVTSERLRSDFLQIAREFNKTCLLITHRIDDALEMADRALGFEAPAKVALEVRITRRRGPNPAQDRRPSCADRIRQWAKPPIPNIEIIGDERLWNTRTSYSNGKTAGSKSRSTGPRS